jgi:hypothetical protein
MCDPVRVRVRKVTNDTMYELVCTFDARSLFRAEFPRSHEGCECLHFLSQKETARHCMAVHGAFRGAASVLGPSDSAACSAAAPRPRHVRYYSTYSFENSKKYRTLRSSFIFRMLKSPRSSYVFLQRNTTEHWSVPTYTPHKCVNVRARNTNLQYMRSPVGCACRRCYCAR